MNFEFTEEQLMIQKAARDFAQNELLPGVIERDEHQKFPVEQVKKLGKLGFLGMMIPAEYGGSGLDTVSYVLAMEEISKVDASVSVIMSVNNSLVCWGIELFGNEEQKKKYLMPLAKGEIIGAFCLSEPEAGSDATSQQTTAMDKGDYYLLNGTKNWITNGSTASVYLVMAQTDASKGHKGINCLIVEKGMTGFTVGPKENKLGIRGSDTHSLMFTDVKVPKENRIGEEQHLQDPRVEGLPGKSDNRWGRGQNTQPEIDFNGCIRDGGRSPGTSDCQGRGGAVRRGAWRCGSTGGFPPSVEGRG